MKSRLFSRQEIVLALLVGFALAMFIHTTLFPRDISGESTSMSGISREGVVGIPVRLRIPHLQIDSAIALMGLTSLGALDTPTNPRDAGWFALGPRPGEVGNAIIDGHFGWKDDVQAIFDDLHTLRVGDRIIVDDEAGNSVTFIVRVLRTYNPADDAHEVFNSSDGGAHLNLITCQGVWNKTTKSYSERLVVFADRRE